MATTFYGKKNNAKSTITNNPLSSGGLSITLASSTGGRFPAATAFLATIWDAVTYSDPFDDSNMEIVKCDSVSGDTVTVNASGRGFAGTSAVSHATGSAFRLLIMKEHADQWETAITNLEAWADPTGASTGSQVLGYAEITADQNTISTITDLTNLSVTVTVPSGGRRVRVTGWVRVTNSTGPINTHVYIRESSTQLMSHDITVGGAWTNIFIPMWVGTPSAGSHTYKLSAAVDSGTINIGASSTTPCFILVELL